mmetsp:Transcript_13908/g.30550  ORF Transcript_13908/g.30550 Transcript_13908/m.30550 type:complete len:125 (+) Transcript_13908:478-852(+)
MLTPGTDELKMILEEEFEFEVKEWSVDENAVDYRYDEMEKEPRYTRYEGYRPLRFVLQKGGNKTKDDDENLLGRIMQLRKEEEEAKNQMKEEEDAEGEKLTNQNDEGGHFPDYYDSNVTIEEIE